MDELTGSSARVASELKRLGLSAEVRVMPASTRSAADAAGAIGCDIAQIVKSLIFRTVEKDEPVLVLASGANRVDLARLGEIVADQVVQADAAFVRARTGFAIGGVAPVGHLQPVATYFDKDLLQHDVVWAAAGSPSAVFPVAPVDLVRVTSAVVVVLAAP
jgi:prolyl-tRNA editing enzyme YbaK/EbsC (Cys-tRNA(Pro) deacylase)